MLSTLGSEIVRSCCKYQWPYIPVYSKMCHYYYYYYYHHHHPRDQYSYCCWR